MYLVSSSIWLYPIFNPSALTYVLPPYLALHRVLPLKVNLTTHDVHWYLKLSIPAPEYAQRYCMACIRTLSNKVAESNLLPLNPCPNPLFLHPAYVYSARGGMMSNEGETWLSISIFAFCFHKECAHFPREEKVEKLPFPWYIMYVSIIIIIIIDALYPGT